MVTIREALLTSNLQVEQERPVRAGGDLALVLPGVLAGDVPDQDLPLRRAQLVVGLHPKVGGVGVASHGQQRHV